MIIPVALVLILEMRSVISFKEPLQCHTIGEYCWDDPNEDCVQVGAIRRLPVFTKCLSQTQVCFEVFWYENDNLMNKWYFKGCWEEEQCIRMQKGIKNAFANTFVKSYWGPRDNYASSERSYLSSTMFNCSYCDWSKCNGASQLTYPGVLTILGILAFSNLN